MQDARLVAQELQDRYEPLRAVVLVSRLMQKAMFAGRSSGRSCTPTIAGAS